MINSIIHVIVPTKEEMSDLFERLNDFFSDTFGFLYYPFEFMIEMFDSLMSADNDTSITFPGFSIMGHEVWADTKYNIADNAIAKQVFDSVRIGTGVLLSMWFVVYLRRFFEKQFGSGGQA